MPPKIDDIDIFEPSTMDFPAYLAKFQTLMAVAFPACAGIGLSPWVGLQVELEVTGAKLFQENARTGALNNVPGYMKVDMPGHGAANTQQRRLQMEGVVLWFCGWVGG